MKIILRAEILMLVGLAMCMGALFFPLALPILIFFSIGNLLIIAGFVLYLRIVLKDLKKHKVL